jgi:hypothetical protein
MLELTRADLQDRIAAAARAVIGAQDEATAAQAGADAAVQALTAAQAVVPGAQQALDATQAAVEAAQGRADAAQRKSDAAAQRLAEWLGEEPDRELPNGHVNPDWGTWATERERRERAVEQAEGDLAAAGQALAQEQARRNGAQAALAAADAAVAAATAGAAQAQDQLAAATSALADARAAQAALEAVLADLDAQAAAIAAEPLDRPAVEAAADAMLAAALGLRHERQDRWGERLALVRDRRDALADHDDMAEDLATLSAAVRAEPGLAGVADALDPVVAESRAQRARPERTDDLHETAIALGRAAMALQATASAAVSARDQWAATLEQDAQDLEVINADAPRR